MKKNYLISAGWIIYILILCLISYLQISIPEPALPGYTPHSFSAYRAYDHVQQIASEPHSGGTNAHRAVRNYIYDLCKQAKLETKVYASTGMRARGSHITAARTYNILAKLKGSENSKAVLIMAHYDSQPNTPGASDNTAGVAAMLETISLLSKQPQLKNDIYFLFIDMEEVGLLGSEAFVSSFPELDHIGLALNFDCRGNSGPTLIFETSSQNGWVVRELANAVNGPLANSLAYEIYKLMPNDTDFTQFKRAGISGFNASFADGFAYYHSAADKPEYLNLGSLQGLGEVMWQSVNHFGNQNLTTTKSEDVIYYPIGSWLIVYGKSTDTILFILSILIFGLMVGILFRKGQLNLISIIKAFGIYLLSMVIGLFLTWLLDALVLVINPHYTSFYSNSFYNSNSYLLCFIGAASIAYFTINGIWRKFSTQDHLIGGLILQLILLVILKIYVPSGAYIIYIPLLFASSLLIANQYLADRYRLVVEAFIPIVPFLFWVPFIYLLFVIFSLQLPYASVLFILLILPYLIFIVKTVNESFRWSLSIISIILVVFGLMLSQTSAKPTKEKPQQTRLSYGMDIDNKRAIWFTRQEFKDDFLSNYIRNDVRRPLTEIYEDSRGSYLKDDAPFININTATVRVESDTVINNQREVLIRLVPGIEVTWFDLQIPEKAKFLAIDERKVLSEEVHSLRYFAPEAAGCFLKIVSEDDSPIVMTLVESKLVISERLLTHPLPENYVWGTDYMSNNMLFKKTIGI